MGRAREEKSRRKKIREEKDRRKKIQVCEKVEKSQKHSVFPMFCGSGGSKTRLAKAAGAEPHLEVKMLKTPHIRLLELEMSKKCTSLSRKAHFEVKLVTTFGG